MSETIRKRGRPKTRNSEPLMYAIWNLVMREIHVKGAKNISRACDSIIRRSNKINFVDEHGKATTSIVDDVKLRQWFYEAENARQLPDQYPILSQRCSIDLQILPGMKQRLDEMKPEFRKRKLMNEWSKEYDCEKDRFID